MEDLWIIVMLILVGFVIAGIVANAIDLVMWFTGKLNAMGGDEYPDEEGDGED